jgi:hypothetical protein
MEVGSEEGHLGVDVIATPPQREANATVHLLGGKTLEVVQGPNVANSRIEAAYEAAGRYASLTDTSGKAAFVNPVAVAYLELRSSLTTAPAEGYLGPAAPREAKARVHFMDGRSIDVVQGISIANKRLEEVRVTAGLFAYFTQSSGTPVYVNRVSVTHLTADPH